MGRIRTIKPSFFRHELLQDLENDNPNKHVMLTFAGLWTICDSKGRFEYKPRLMSLDILPFLNFDISETLDILHEQGFIVRYSVNNSEYAYIPSFLEHQRITGKEATDGERFPECTQGIIRETTGKHPVSQEGKGKEGEMERSFLSVTSDDVKTDKKIVNKWIEGFDLRKEEFKNKLRPYVKTKNNIEGLYAGDMIKKFFDYWSEPNKSGSKMKFELEKTWDLSKRLIRWSDNNFGSQKQDAVVFQNPTQPIDHSNRS